MLPTGHSFIAHQILSVEQRLSNRYMYLQSTKCNLFFQLTVSLTIDVQLYGHVCSWLHQSGSQQLTAFDSASKINRPKTNWEAKFTLLPPNEVTTLTVLIKCIKNGTDPRFSMAVTLAVLSEFSRRRTINDLCAEVGIGYGSCQRIVTEQLNMHRIAAKFVPRVLT